MIQWWVLYRFAAANDHQDCHPASVPVEELSIVRLLADVTTGGTPCAYCFARRQPTCPGMRLHVAMERERAELDASGLLQVAVIDLPEWMGWHLALSAIKTLILAQEIISAP